MLAAIPFLFSTASARAIAMAQLDQMRSEKRDEGSYSLNSNIVGELGATIKKTLQNDPSLNDTKILVDLEGAINGELSILHASLEKLNPLQIGGVLEKAVNQISNQLGDYEDKLTSDLDDTVGSLLGIL